MEIARGKQVEKGSPRFLFMIKISLKEGKVENN